MILIAESGSTKTNWRGLLKGQAPVELPNTEGFNPEVVSDEAIFRALFNRFLPQLEAQQLPAASAVFFYGAGCSSAPAQTRVSDVLSQVFPSATISVEHDLLAAARATAGDDAGIIAILGTGSSACYFDGEAITEMHGEHGYLLDDLGGGVSLGRHLFRAWAEGELPKAAAATLEKHVGGAPLDFRTALYKAERPNAKLANLVSALPVSDFPEVWAQVAPPCFEAFFEQTLERFQQRAPLHLIGSIAHHFQAYIAPVAEQHGWPIASVVAAPIEGLVHYHRQHLP